MTKDEDFKLLKIQTCVLRVNIHCDGCKQKVKKLLQRIEGVFQVKIDSEQQKVTVLGSVDPTTLIKRLVRAGKHAELWSAKLTQNQKHQNNCIKDEKNNNKREKQAMVKGPEAFKNQQKLSSLSFEEDEDYFDDEEDEEDGFQLLREKANPMNLLRQQGFDGKKGVGSLAASGNSIKLNNNGGIGNAGKKMDQNQHLGIKAGSSGIDQRTIAALKMNNPNLGECKKVNDLGSMMNLAGFHGNAPTLGSSSLGHNSNNLGGGFHLPPNNVSQIPSSSGCPNNGYTSGQYPSAMMMNMNHPSSMMMNMNHPSSMMMNMNRQQPQMMYHRSPMIRSNTGYYYHNPHPYSESNGSGNNSAAYMFSDENTSSCSIM